MNVLMEINIKQALLSLYVNLSKKWAFTVDGGQIEETILENLAWKADSPLWDAVQKCGSSLSVEEVFSCCFTVDSVFHLFKSLCTHTRLMALFPGLPRWAGTRKVKTNWILLKQETVSGNGISWAICKSAPRSREITMPATHHSLFYRPDALPATQPTASKHWRDALCS